MIVPCDGMRRGTEATVPIVPGLVSEMRRAFEVGDLERVVARLADDVVVGLEELREVHASARA